MATLVVGAPVGAGPEVLQQRGLGTRHMIACAGTGVPNVFNDELSAPPSPQHFVKALSLRQASSAAPGSGAVPDVQGGVVVPTGTPGKIDGTG